MKIATSQRFSAAAIRKYTTKLYCVEKKPHIIPLLQNFVTTFMIVTHRARHTMQLSFPQFFFLLFLRLRDLITRMSVAREVRCRTKSALYMCNALIAPYGRERSSITKRKKEVYERSSDFSKRYLLCKSLYY